MNHPALSLHQPYPQLVVMGIKKYETRSWPCPPALIGQPLIFHATTKRPKRGTKVGSWFTHAWFDSVDHADDCDCDDGDWVGWSCQRRSTWRPKMGNYDGSLLVDLPLGAIVGSGRVAACYLMITDDDWRPEGGYVKLNGYGKAVLWLDGEPTDISADVPYGDWSPGRYAWQIEDAAPTQERCPWCWGKCGYPVEVSPGDIAMHGNHCPVCDDAGRCNPIPARGAQRIWNWEPV